MKEKILEFFSENDYELLQDFKILCQFLQILQGLAIDE